MNTKLTQLIRLLPVLLLALALSACNDKEDCCIPDPNPNPNPGPEEPPPPSCDDYRPVIFLHGFLGSGDTYALQVQRFSTNGYCDDRLYAFDWNTLGNRDSAVLQLDGFIDAVLTATGAAKVDLAGHSAGGGLGYNYLADGSRAAKVAHYAHLGSFAQTTPAGPSGEVPTINIWSENDEVVESADIPGAENVKLSGFDHYQVATVAPTFEAMFRFFNDGADPATTDVEAQPEISIAGRVVTLGENIPQAGASVEIYELDPATGFRLGAAAASLTTDAEGNWGPWTAKPATPYEFFINTGKEGDRLVHYFREGFQRSNQLVYLRSLPPPTSTAGLLLSAVPQNDNQSVVAVFCANQAVISGRDQLGVDGFDLATERYAPAAATNIAFFLYDDGNLQTSGNPHPVFSFLGAFLTGIDYFIPTTPATTVSLTFNGRTLNVPNLKSKTDGVVVAVFE